eukprot:TRINITY_DN251_c0_g1_i7.p1 TRINITY_DN251_c0_g1~~TRINITY_DN251_c0_g1_i7.p1  ORF type:complete len:151 (-),score=9.79 TRINITY_DN251_c0_g1_i7:181-633(-)
MGEPLTQGWMMNDVSRLKQLCVPDVEKNSQMMKRDACTWRVELREKKRRGGREREEGRSLIVWWGCRYHNGTQNQERCARMRGGGRSTGTWQCCGATYVCGGWEDDDGKEVEVNLSGPGCTKGKHVLELGQDEDTQARQNTTGKPDSDFI